MIRQVTNTHLKIDRMTQRDEQNSGLIDRTGLTVFATRESASESQTQDIGREFSRAIELPKTVCLSGQLGAGKTQFVKGIAHNFGVSSEIVVSPTFGILNLYGGDQLIQHLDLYRLADEDEFLNLGPDELFEKNALTLIEWGEKFMQSLPSATVFVQFEILDDSKRQITFLCNPDLLNEMLVKFK